MERSLERAFRQLDLADAPPTHPGPVEAHPAAFVDKPLPSPPPPAGGSSGESPECSGHRYGQAGTGGKKRAADGQGDRPTPGFGLPLPPARGAAPAISRPGGQESLGPVVVPPTPTGHRHSISAPACASAPAGPTRKELLNARFVAHSASSSRNQPHQPPAAPPRAAIASPSSASAPPDYSVFDPVSPGPAGHQGLPWATRPVDRHPQQPLPTPRPPPLSSASSYRPVHYQHPARSRSQPAYSPARPVAYGSAAGQHPSWPVPLPPHEPYCAQPYYHQHHPAAVASPYTRSPMPSAYAVHPSADAAGRPHYWLAPTAAQPAAAHPPSLVPSVTLNPVAPSTPRRSPPLSATALPALNSPAGPDGSPSASRQCAGSTQKGARCRNKLKSVDGDVTSDFCHVHSAIILDEVGFYLAGGGRTYVLFEDWIPTYLERGAQVGLRVEMERPLTLFDKGERGFVYAFEYRGLQTIDSRMFKVGLSRNPIARLDQWAKQCPSHDPLLLGVVPTSVELGDGADGARMRGVRRVGGEGMPGAGRLERLVHLEIGGMVKAKRTKEVCIDCKKVHQELFPLPRLASGREWEDVVLPIMRRWERFVRLVAAEPGHG